MAENEEWFVGEDGSLTLGEQTGEIAYHSSLNTLLVATRDSKLRVIDVTSGSVLQNSDLSAGRTADGIRCSYLPCQDKVLFSNGYAVGVRKDFNGVMLLDTALQTSVQQTEDVIRVELPLPDASQLFKSLMSAELAGVDHVEDVLKELENEIEAAQTATKHNHKIAKWATVCLKLPYFTLKTVCSALVVELKRLHQNVPGLSVASAVSDRLLYLLPNSRESAFSSVDRSLMYSEASRRETFDKWPHMNYKWALPDPMAKAGFYHQPNSTGDDRAMCFTCNVCLVCWEPTDEPWSEHERHSSSCPFVKGEHTQNVPLSVTHSTEPASLHGDKTDKIACISTTANCDLFATSTLHGNVVIWDCTRLLKKSVTFHIDPSDRMLSSPFMGDPLSNMDIDVPNSADSLTVHTQGYMSESSTSQDSDCSQDSVREVSSWSGSQTPAKDGTGDDDDDDDDDDDSKDSKSGDNQQTTNQDQNQNDDQSSTSAIQEESMELQELTSSDEPAQITSELEKKGQCKIIEVKGAWQKKETTPADSVIEIPLNSVSETSSDHSSEKELHRPSRDVIVTALCTIGPSMNKQSNSTGESNAHPSLISGVIIRMANNAQSSGSSHMSGISEERNEVQALNQVNQAISEETKCEIISGGPSSSETSTGSSRSRQMSTGASAFVPYLLVHSIKKNRKEASKLKEASSKASVSSQSKIELKVNKSKHLVSWPPLMLDDLKQETMSDATSSSTSLSVVPGSYTTQKDSPTSSCMLSDQSSSRSSQPKEGSVVQCVLLPAQVGNDQYIHSITPTLDGRHIIVVTAPKCLNRKLEALYSSQSSEEDFDEDNIGSQGGCILIYKVKHDGDCVTLEQLPCVTKVIDTLADAVIHVSMLPIELAGNNDLLSGDGSQDDNTELGRQNSDILQGYVALTTHSGQVKILSIEDLAVLATISPLENDKYISSIFCTGIDRLCCSSEAGRLCFYMVGPRRMHIEDLALGLESTASLSNGAPIQEDMPDCVAAASDMIKSDSLLAHQLLTAEVLRGLHDLTQFQNLVPRFCATVPPCWNEIQQEQQQRRHPLHLQQQGDATQHTRSWRLQQDSSSWDEHLFELVIPKSCCVGHIDIKFSLHPLCTTAPSIQVTLLRQSMSKLGRNIGPQDAEPIITNHPETKDVDAKVDFNLHNLFSGSQSITDEDKVDQSEECKANTSVSEGSKSGSSNLPADEPNPSSSTSQPERPSFSSSKPTVNPVKTRQFLDRHGAEILCGPLDLNECVDLSGHGGIITLTGPELLKIKSRSFLLHFKAMAPTAPEKYSKSRSTAKKEQVSSHKSVPRQAFMKKLANKVYKDLSDMPFLSTQERLASLTSKQKLENIRGCDWLQELSVTVRRCQPVNIPRERLQRITMLEDQGLHERLIKLVCDQDDTSSSPLTDQSRAAAMSEHRRIVALDILSWICAVQSSAIDKSGEHLGLVVTTESFLKPLVKACYLEASRTIAHQFTKFITALIECAKSLDNQNAAPDLCYSILASLLESLPSVPVARSAGALHWFFVLLNRVKCMDVATTGTKCVEMLAAVTKYYNDRNNPLHAILKSRFGLYGHPLEPDMFDIEPPGLAKNTSTSNLSYSSIVGNMNNNNNNGGTTASSPSGIDETDVRDYLQLTSSDRGSGSNSSKASDQISSHVFGLLEVEPLHFTCHAASDGTRVERLDMSSGVGPTSSVSSAVAGLSGTINFGGESASAQMPNAMSSLSAATEHQLSVLHQKHLQLLKLQQQKQKLEQKLAETSKTSVYNNPELFPPTPKNTPFFMTPPVTPPNEAYHNIFVGGSSSNDPGKPPTGKDKGGDSKPNQLKSSFFWSQTQHLFQPMPPQALVIERMHSGARRFVVLDFGKPILLTDMVIPGCGDLQSLSVDVWTQGEDLDGRRLVVASDIGMRSLVLSDLCPPPLCRYLKITTIGRHGGSAARSKIPLGSFYGHSFVPPWHAGLPPMTAPTTPSDQPETSSAPSPTHTEEQSQVMSQLGLCMSLHEDIQCRYSLSCNRLVSLLSLVQVPHNSVDHTLYFLKQGRKTEDDKRVIQAYQDCVSLQLQLNLAQWAIDRLQGLLGIRPTPPSHPHSMGHLLKQASSDKLRVLSEFLLDTLLRMTCPSVTVPQVPTSLYTAFTPNLCDALFRHLCVTGTKKIQIHTGVLLVRLCGNQPWWGEFLGNILQQYFTSEQPLVFPRDRVFLVLCALSQKALCSNNASCVLESLVSLLGHLLAPLLQTNTSHYRSIPAVVDQCLISWMLLFLSRSLDSTTPSWAEESNDKSSKEKDNGGLSNRWDFLQGESSLQKKGGAARSRKSYHSRSRGRFINPGYQLQMQQKKDVLTDQAQKALSTVYASPKPEAYKLEALTKTHSMIKKQNKLYSSKLFKDMVNSRRTHGEFMKRMAKDDMTASGNDVQTFDGDGDIPISLSRDKCIPVVKGLVALLLSTDFTCHVDLFIVSCKVLARIASITRPVLMLSEVVSQQELEKLILLTCNADYNHGNVNWGGSWAGHSIACLLQDILDGERIFGLTTEGAPDEDVTPSLVTETDDSLQNSTTLPTIEEDNSSNNTTEPDILQGLENNNSIPDPPKPQAEDVDNDLEFLTDMMFNSDDQHQQTKKYNQTFQQMIETLTLGNKSGQMQNVLGGLTWSDTIQASPMENGKLNIIVKKCKQAAANNQQYGLKMTTSPQGISTAMDARLEQGVLLPIELKLKVMISLEIESIQNALTAPLPPLPPALIHPPRDRSHAATDDEQLSENSGISGASHTRITPSSDMLSICFKTLFCHRVNLDSLLLLWLTLNEETTQEENGVVTFDPSRIPSIALSEAAVGSLLASLYHAPHVPVRTWVLAFQCLTLLSNLKYQPEDTSHGSGGEKWLAQVILADPNLMNVMLKFLSGATAQGLVISSQQHSQIGPIAVRSFHEVLVRLQLRCSEDNDNLMRELLLRLVYQLSTDRGAFALGLGPLDAQCRLLDHMLEQSYENVDTNNAISVIESVSSLVHNHILSQERVGCRSSIESGVSARSCFGGLFASVLRTGNSRSMTGDANQDLLMSNLLSLVNLLMQASVPRRTNRRSTTGSVSVMDTSELRDLGAVGGIDSPMTDTSKITHSMATTGVIMTSTPILPLSDDEKGAETDEQKTEHAVPAPKPPPGLKPPPERKSCSHFWDVNNPDAECKNATLSDFVLGHHQIMFHLLHALGSCNSNAIATIVGSSGNINDSFVGLDPLSVGDGIFQILCTMNRKATNLDLILKPVYQYLSSNVPSGFPSGLCQLSEPLLWFVLCVLDCEHAITTFLEMGGIEIVCRNLVSSSRNVISTSPGLVSTIMQYLGVARGKSSLPRKIPLSESDGSNDYLQNLAPIGTIYSSTPSAGPADVLIQGVAPHRRARSAAWSFNFYPHEAWVDLIVSLPCAVLLKEVHIQPHLASLATCPSAVTLEVSRDGSTTIPITAPLVTSGLNSIKIMLHRPEVVTMVTIRLHKPRDSNTIGLSQIRLLGTPAFGDTVAAKAIGVNGNGEDYVARTSLGWLRLLHHCLTHCEAVEDMVARAAAPVQPLLVTCTSLLLSSGATLYVSNIEAVLLKLGLHSADMGLGLIDHLLRNTRNRMTMHGIGSLGRSTAVANESTVDLLYQLGISQDQATCFRVKAMTDWLGDCARLALQRSHGGGSAEAFRLMSHQSSGLELPPPAPAHVHCVAAVLWQSQQQRSSYNLAGIVSRDLLSSMYEWSMGLPVDSALKKAVDAVICSICYIHPEHFSTLLEWIGIVTSLDLSSAPLTDDHKDSHKDHRQISMQEAMTDDLKATTEAHRSIDLSMGFDGSLQPIILQEISHMMLDECHLSTLSIACQSPICLHQLLESGFLAVLCQGLYEFCLREMSRSGEPVILSEMFTEGSHSAGSSLPSSPRGGSLPKGTRRRGSSESLHQDKSVTITADLAAAVLRFLGDISREVVVKAWLGSPEGCIFWPVLLRLLCSAPVPMAQTITVTPNRFKAMTVQQRSAIETTTIDFFSNVLSCHQSNQLQFANILCDVIRGQGSTVDEYGYRSSPLCGFMRCLFLQVLLEDEKLWVCLKASSQLYKGHSNALTALVQHPRFGAGHKYRVLQVSLQSTCDDIMNKVSDTPSLVTQTAQLLEDKENKVFGDDWFADSSEMGIEAMVEQMTAAAGLQAKEKRDKTGAKCASPSRPPRPPSRRGHVPSEGLAGMQIPVLMLYHDLLPDQPLPGDLTLSQLLILLKERGLSEGQASIDFSMQFKTRPLGSGAKADGSSRRDDWMGTGTEPIPRAILLETPSMATALQVFAGVGGLALLAEHLPLLYPELTRQGSPIDGGKDITGPGGLGQDWVTVENSDDIYEEIYEPIPPNQPSSSSKPPVASPPSIPPHSLVAFGLFLRLPGYAEVLLKEKKKAQCLLRLVLGVTDDGEGGHILTSPIASSLPALPFNVLKQLFDTTPLSTDDGVLLRRMTLDIGAVHLVLACLSVLSHHAPRENIPGLHQEIILAATQAASAIGSTSTSSSTPVPPKPTTEDRSQLYWAKGTGFGTGSTASYWDAEQALVRQRCEEEHCTCLLQVLASFINPGGEVPGDFVERDYDDDEGDSIPLPVSLPDLLAQSCLAPAICSYLRNDSVLDMARHVPLYRALLELLRGLAVCPVLVPLLLPLDKDDDSAISISSLLDKMKVCVDTYASRLKTNKKAKAQKEDEESEGLALLIPDIQSTARVVDAAIHRIREKSADMEDSSDYVDSGLQGASKVDHSLEDRYTAIMRELQFDTFEMVVDEEGKLEFTVPHHYESNVKAAGEINNASRARRLAQEAVTLSTSLPLSAGSSVFVRCDEERLDVMKVLITGPSDTPYENGCFEFDVYFPQDYPNTPPQINLETTGNHAVRFNPNLYNDGKVCLSILNTWHGRPEEKWNSQTSSFLQVLVSIQSLILVSEPYFNEPGYERSRGTASGTSCSKEYDANIRQASVKWAMLEMMRNPPASFKEVLECHFWLKKNEIIGQIEDWITDLEANCGDKRVGRTITHSCVALKRHFAQLKEEFAKMKCPASLTDEEGNPEESPAARGNPRPPKPTEKPPPEPSPPVLCDGPTQAVGTSTSGQVMSNLENIIEVMQLEPDFGSFSDDSSEDMDIDDEVMELAESPCQYMNSLPNSTQEMDEVLGGPSQYMNSIPDMDSSQASAHMNSISPTSPTEGEGQANALPNDLPKSNSSDFYL